MFEGLEVDPNPSSFLPLYFFSHNSTNCIPITNITIYILANYHPLLTHCYNEVAILILSDYNLQTLLTITFNPTISFNLK